MNISKILRITLHLEHLHTCHTTFCDVFNTMWYGYQMAPHGFHTLKWCEFMTFSLWLIMGLCIICLLEAKWTLIEASLWRSISNWCNLLILSDVTIVKLQYARYCTAHVGSDTERTGQYWTKKSKLDRCTTCTPLHVLHVLYMHTLMILWKWRYFKLSLPSFN